MKTKKRLELTMSVVQRKLKSATALLLVFTLLFSTIETAAMQTYSFDNPLHAAIDFISEEETTNATEVTTPATEADIPPTEQTTPATEANTHSTEPTTHATEPLTPTDPDLDTITGFNTIPIIQTNLKGKEANGLTPATHSALVTQITSLINSSNKPTSMTVGDTTVRIVFDEYWPGGPGDTYAYVNNVRWNHAYINTNDNSQLNTALFVFENLEREIWIGFARSYSYGNIRFVGIGNVPAAYNMPDIIYVGFDPGGEMYGVIPQYISDPVDIINGNLVWENTDIALHGSQPLPFTRYYNSQDKSDSTMGVGWRHNYEYHLKYDDDTEQFIVAIPNGFEYRFTHIGQGIGQADVPYVGFRMTTQNTFIFTAHDGTEVTFDEYGRVATIIDIYGNETQLEYSNDILSEVTNRSGSLVFEYGTFPDGNRRMQSVTAVPADGNNGNNETRTITYGYTNYDDDYALTQFTNADNDTQTYGYVGEFNLATVTNFNGEVTLTNTYDNHNQVTTQKIADQGLSYFTYDYISRMNTFTNPAGLVTEYYYDQNGKIARTEEYQQGTTNRVIRSQSMVNGLLMSSTDYMGNVTTYTYDTQGNRTSVTHPDQTKEAFEYNEKRQITSSTLTDENGAILETLTYEYSHPTGGNLRKVIFAPQTSGGASQPPSEPPHTREFIYNTQNDLIAYIDANGNETTLTHDTRGNVTSITDPTGYTTEYTYDIHGRLETETAPMNGSTAPRNITRYEYSEASKLLRIIYPDNTIQTAFDVNGNGFNEEVTDPLGNVTNIAYSTMSRPLSVTDSRGGVTTYGYDTSGRLTQVTDPENNAKTANPLSTLYTYDTRGRVATQTEPNQNQANLAPSASPATWQFSYNDNNDLTVILTPDNGRTDTAYDNMGQITSISRQKTEANATTNTEAVTETIQFTYDRLGNITLITDPLGNTQGAEYDRYGNMTRFVDSNGNEWQYIYDNESQLLEIIDPINGSTNPTAFEYDTAGRLTKTITPANVTYLYEYNANALLYKVTEVTEPQNPQNPQNRTWLNVYDSMGRLTRQTNPDGTYSQLEYDKNGQLTKVIDENDNTVSYTYDPNGNVATITDATNNAKPELERETIHFTYDLNNRLTEVKHIRLADEAVLRTYASYSYDDNGNITSVEANGSRTEWDYDVMNRPIRERSASNGERLFEYNKAGELTSLTNGRGTELAFAYDLNGQMTHGVGVDYTYDPNGNVLTVTNENGTIVREYDQLNRVTKYTDVNGNEIERMYDADSRITAITYASDNAGNNATTKTVSYDYNQSGQLVQVTDYNGRITAYTYNQNGQLHTTTRPDGSVETRTYDNAGRITRSITVSTTITNGTNIINDYSYEYDNNGNFTSEENDIPDLLLELPLPAIMTYRADNRNQLGTYDGQAVIFDMDGNMTYGPLSDGFVEYEYDNLNQLTSVGNATVGNTTYTYDGEGNRVSQTVSETVNGQTANEQTTTYVTNPNTELSQLLITNHPDGSQTFYVYGLGLISQERIYNEATDNGATGNGATEYRIFHYDYRGSTTALTDINGTVTDRWAYILSGEIIGREGTTETIFQFVGQWGVQTDSNGLYFMRARYYNPTISRFINEDFHWNIHNMQYGDSPSYVSGGYTHTNGGYASDMARIPHMPSILQSANRYGYAMHNPIMYNDPSGLFIGTALDVASVAWSTSALIRKPSWANAGYLALDVVGATLPFVPAIGTMIRAKRASKALKVAGIVRVVDTATDVTRVARAARVARVTGRVTANAADVNRVVRATDRAATVNRAVRTADRATDVTSNASRVTRGAGNVPLTNGSRMTTSNALDAASDYLGSGYSDMGGGRFVSADRTRQVRFTNSDLTPINNHAGAPHMNFETLVPNPRKPGGVIPDPTKNIHIYLLD
ncbi:MAG: DUF6531 domain-containing protein [Defluviitaleaceae bacterium]|nr:DUF6531 domain-containing protein [Defluviitaleaceae bacterium]